MGPICLVFLQTVDDGSAGQAPSSGQRGVAGRCLPNLNCMSVGSSDPLTRYDVPWEPDTTKMTGALYQQGSQANWTNLQSRILSHVVGPV